MSEPFPETPSTPPARPGVVTAAGVLLIVGGALGAIGGIVIFSAGAVGAGFVLLGLVLLAIAAVQIWAGMQVLALKENGRKVAVVIAGIGAVLALLSIGRTPGTAVIQLALNGFVIWALVQNQHVFTR